MAIGRNLIIESITAIAAIPNVEMDPEALAADVFLVANNWTEPDDFKRVIANVERILRLIADKRITGEPLKYNHVTWLSYHFQSKVVQKQKADMRTLYREITEQLIKVRGFGHRHIPIDFYERMHQDR